MNNKRIILTEKTIAPHFNGMTFSSWKDKKGLITKVEIHKDFLKHGSVALLKKDMKDIFYKGYNENIEWIIPDMKLKSNV